MKKILQLITLLLITNIFLINVAAQSAEPTETPEGEPTPEATTSPVVDNLYLNAPSAILIDGKTGNILYEKNAYQGYQSGSLNKIMTVYLATQKLDDNATLTASSTAIDGFDRNTSHLWLTYDEQLSAIDLENAAMLANANDAANILAEGVSGSLDGFVSYMNEISNSLNLTGTNFTNATGNYDANQYTTAFDMAMITRLALKDEKFKTVFSNVSYAMNPTNKQENVRQFATGNEMLRSSDFTYEYTTGGKNSFLEDSGYSFVCSSTKGTMDLIGVVMGVDSEDKLYTDMTKMFEYGFSNYKTVVISNAEIEPEVIEINEGNKTRAKVTFTAPDSFSVLLPSDTDESLITTGTVIRNENDIDMAEGYVILYIDGEQAGQMQMNKDVEMLDTSFEKTTLPALLEYFDKISLGVLALFIGIKIVRYIINNTKLPE